MVLLLYCYGTIGIYSVKNSQKSNMVKIVIIKLICQTIPVTYTNNNHATVTPKCLKYLKKKFFRKGLASWPASCFTRLNSKLAVN